MGRVPLHERAKKRGPPVLVGDRAAGLHARGFVGPHSRQPTNFLFLTAVDARRRMMATALYYFEMVVIIGSSCL